MPEIRNSENIPQETTEFERFSVEILSQGKTPKRNEDKLLVDADVLAVVDGATPKVELDFDGKSGGEFAGEAIVEALKTQKKLYGKELIDYLSREMGQKLQNLNLTKKIEGRPEARPTAALAVATFSGKNLFITQLGDVSVRINGEQILEDRKEIDVILARRRVETISQLKGENLNLSNEEILKRGREAIQDDLERQVIEMQNNPSHELGYGAIDGRRVDPKWVKLYKYKLSEIKTLEIFSDGYFKPAARPAIDSWEQAFREVEAEDPHKIGKFPSTKGSSSDAYTDDRTILIVRFK